MAAFASPCRITEPECLTLCAPYVLLAGVIAAAAIFYINTLVGFPILDVSLAAVVVAIMVVRGLFRMAAPTASPINCFCSSPNTIEMVTSAVRSGLPVDEAFRAISREMPQQTAGQFAILCSELALGRPPENAMEGVYQRTQVPEYGFFAVTLGVQMKSGGGLASKPRKRWATRCVGVLRWLLARNSGRRSDLSRKGVIGGSALRLSAGSSTLISPVTVDLLFTRSDRKEASGIRPEPR